MSSALCLHIVCPSFWRGDLTQLTFVRAGDATCTPRVKNQCINLCLALPARSAKHKLPSHTFPADALHDQYMPAFWSHISSRCMQGNKGGPNTAPSTKTIALSWRFGWFSWLGDLCCCIGPGWPSLKRETPPRCDVSANFAAPIHSQSPDFTRCVCVCVCFGFSSPALQQAN